MYKNIQKKKLNILLKELIFIYKRYTNYMEKIQINPDVIKQKLLFNNDLELLPEDVLISTMTVTCKLNTIFNVGNIARYIDLKHSAIMAVSHGNFEDPTINRSIISKKRNKHKNKKQKKSFYNQVSLHVRVTGSNAVNIKLFLNGSIQITGCKTIEGITEALEKVFIELHTIKAVVNFKDNVIEDKLFVSNLKNLRTENLFNFQICMINSNFTIGFEIDRDKLFELLIADNITCSYDPIVHACVSIKHDHPDKTISVFVFESGAVIITGARTCAQIVSAYNFVNKYLLEHYVEINKNSQLTNSSILEYLNSNDFDKKDSKQINKKNENDDEYIARLMNEQLNN